MWRAAFVPPKENLSRGRKTNERMDEEVRGGSRTDNETRRKGEGEEK